MSAPVVMITGAAGQLGAAVVRAGRHVRGFVRLTGQLMIDMGRLARVPHNGPWRDVSGHLYRIGATALPITALVGFLIGVVLAYLTSQQLKQFGADAYIVNILGVSLIRELGPMLAAILIGIPAGVFAALYHNTVIDRALMAVSFIGQSMPSFFSR